MTNTTTLQSYDDDLADVRVVHFANAHDGPGWYWYYDEYPYEGVCGAFDTCEEATAAAAENPSHRVISEQAVS